MKRNAGFTLIELMIVGSIIAILATIAIPRLMRSKIAANEADAVGGLRTLSSAQTSFQGISAMDVNANGVGEYGSFGQLSSAVPAFIDESLGSGQKAGYFFMVTTTGNASTDEIMWEATAYAISKGRTGNRTFYVNESGVLRGSDVVGSPVGPPGPVATRVIADPVFGGNFPPVAQ